MACGTCVALDARKPTRFCLQYHCRASANSTIGPLVAFPRLLSRCYPLLYHPPVLRLLCANETCSAKWTICVPCRLLLYLCIGTCKGKPMCSEDHTDLQALLLSGRNRASVVEIETAQLRILLSTLLLDMKHDATDRFMRDTICSCYDAQRFFHLYHTMHHSRPLGGGNTVYGVLWPWTPMLHNRRMTSPSCFIISKQVLHLLIQYPGRNKEEV